MFIFLGLLETEIYENEKEREGVLIYKENGPELCSNLGCCKFEFLNQ